MQSNQLDKFLWRRRLGALESTIREAQRDALLLWTMQHTSISAYNMYLIHDLTAPIETSVGGFNTRTKYLAADAIDAANALRRGGNAMVCYQMDLLVGLLREYIDHVKSV